MGNQYNDQIMFDDLLQGRKDSTFMCPTGIDSLGVHGNFGAVNFDYVEMDLLGCDLPDDECFSD